MLFVFALLPFSELFGVVGETCGITKKTGEAGGEVYMISSGHVDFWSLWDTQVGVSSKVRTVMCHIMTFQLMMDYIYDDSPIRS